MSIQMPIQGRHTSQRHASSNEYPHDYSALESKPDSPNARSGAVTRVDPAPGDTARRTGEMCIRVDPTPGDAEQGNAPCPLTTHTRGAPAVGHRYHVSLVQPLFEQGRGSRVSAHPSTGVNTKGECQYRSPTARYRYSPLCI